MLSLLRKLKKQFSIRIRSFGHAGDGNLHVYILKDNLKEKEWHDKLNDVMEAMYHRSKELNGKVSGEHGIGFAKKGYLHEAIGDEMINIMDGIKKAFDPKNLLNPGKVCQ